MYGFMYVNMHGNGACKRRFIFMEEFKEKKQ